LKRRQAKLEFIIVVKKEKKKTERGEEERREFVRRCSEPTQTLH